MSLIANKSSPNDFSSFDFMHYHLNTALNSSAVAVSDPQRLMNRCGSLQGWVFTNSVCEHTKNLQAVRIFCHDPANQHEDSSLQHCELNEICIETGSSSIGVQRAYCVRIQRYSKISYRRGRHTTTVYLPGPAGRAVGQPMSANALLADFSKRFPYSGASLLKLEALELVSNVAKRAVLATVVLKSEECPRCSSIKMQPLPEGTDGLRATVVVEDAEEGYLFLTTIT